MFANGWYLSATFQRDEYQRLLDTILGILAGFQWDQRVVFFVHMWLEEFLVQITKTAENEVLQVEAELTVQTLWLKIKGLSGKILPVEQLFPSVYTSR